MGTDRHEPPAWKKPAHGHPHEDEEKASGPGVRPGVKSRVLEAQERLRKRGEIK